MSKILRINSCLALILLSLLSHQAFAQNDPICDIVWIPEICTEPDPNPSQPNPEYWSFEITYTDLPFDYHINEPQRPYYDGKTIHFLVDTGTVLSEEEYFFKSYYAKHYLGPGQLENAFMNDEWNAEGAHGCIGISRLFICELGFNDPDYPELASKLPSEWEVGDSLLINPDHPDYGQGYAKLIRQSALAPTLVPIPATAWLFASALLGLASTKRQR